MFGTITTVSIREPLAFNAYSKARKAGIANEEFDFVLGFIRSAPDVADLEFRCTPKEWIVEDSTFTQQLRALWTAYCLHHNIMVDTYAYDAAFGIICDAINEAFGDNTISHEVDTDCENSILDAFDLYMSAYLS